MTPLEAVEYLNLSAFVSSLRRPVGWFVEHAPKEVKEALQKLTSNDIQVRIK